MQNLVYNPDPLSLVLPTHSADFNLRINSIGHCPKHLLALFTTVELGAIILNKLTGLFGITLGMA